MSGAIHILAELVLNAVYLMVGELQVGGWQALVFKEALILKHAHILGALVSLFVGHLCLWIHLRHVQMLRRFCGAE